MFEVLLPFPELRVGWGLDLHWSAIAASEAGGSASSTRPRSVTGCGGSPPRTTVRDAVAEARTFLAERPVHNGRGPADPCHASVLVVNVLIVAEYYPRAADPVNGVWAHRQALAARAAGADVRVLVLHRPLPPLSAVRRADLRRGVAVIRQSPRPSWTG